MRLTREAKGDAASNYRLGIRSANLIFCCLIARFVLEPRECARVTERDVGGRCVWLNSRELKSKLVDDYFMRISFLGLNIAARTGHVLQKETSFRSFRNIITILRVCEIVEIQKQFYVLPLIRCC